MCKKTRLDCVKGGMKSFVHSHEDTQDKDDLRITIKVPLVNPGLLVKWP